MHGRYSQNTGSGTAQCVNSFWTLGMRHLQLEDIETICNCSRPGDLPPSSAVPSARLGPPALLPFRVRVAPAARESSSSPKIGPPCRSAQLLDLVTANARAPHER